VQVEHVGRTCSMLGLSLNRTKTTPPYFSPTGVYPPSNIGAIPPQPGEVLREGQGVVLQLPPTRSPNEIFVEYSWTSAVKITLFYS